VRDTKRLAALAATTLLTIAGAVTAQAQAVDSSQLLNIYNNLPADQQQALRQQSGGVVNGGASNTSTNSNKQNANANGNSNNNADGKRTPGKEELTAMDLANLPMRFRVGDSLLLDIDVVRERVVTQTATVAEQGAQRESTLPGAVAGTPATGTPAAITTIKIPAPELSSEETRKRDDLMTLLRVRNPYQLDRTGALLLPGFAPIPLAGLDEEQATKRVAAEPALRNLVVKLVRLPLTKVGTLALKPYGYDLFEDGPNTFAPLSDVPVPSDYVVGPGDEIGVQLYGSQNRTMRLVVSRDGRLSFPELGPISVGGRSFNAVRSDIESRVSRQMIGVRASISMGETRSIRVFVLGEAKYPGSYTVSGLSTVTSALFASGGVKAIGSLRNIELKRQGKVVRQLDLYDLLMRGDTANDSSLLPGDVVFIPPVGATVTVDGEVQRPAIYELKGDTGVRELVQMAGGFTSDADTGRASLTSVDEQSQRVVINVDVRARGATTQSLRNGDLLHVARLRPTLDSGVVLQGEFFRPGNVAWREGVKLADVIPSVNELKPGADQRYLLIRREMPPDRHIVVLSADLNAALADPTAPANVALSAHDQITAFDLGSGREHIIKPLMDELRVQANLSRPAQVVTINGRVKVPGEYPLEESMRVADLIRAGGGLEDAAYGGVAELSRNVIENGQVRHTQVIPVDLAAVVRGDAAANMPLQAFDNLYIKEISGWTEQEQVILKGEVKFPGSYPIKRGETLRSVLERAGGLTDLAFAEGSVFTRLELREQEQAQLNRLAERMKSDLVSTSLMASRANQSGATQTFSIGQTLLEQIKAAKAVGRLVIDLPAVMAGGVGSTADITLRNGDELIVPKQRQEVTVLGEVQNATSHFYKQGRTRDDYLALSGGTTRQGDRNRTYVVRANGSVVANSRGWLFRGGNVDMRPGDTVVVPLNLERTPALPMWQAVTQILYNIAIAAAAVKTF
jgi:protein involved in polysaccharide export with SLBB domain